MRLSYRLVSGLLVLASIVGMSFALYLEHVKGLEPCPLCIFQRVGLMAMGFVALIAFLHNRFPMRLNAFMHFGRCCNFMVSRGGGPTCLATAFTTRSSAKLWSGLNYLIDALPMKTVLQEVLSGSGECAAIDWTF